MNKIALLLALSLSLLSASVSSVETLVPSGGVASEAETTTADDAADDATIDDHVGGSDGEGDDDDDFDDEYYDDLESMSDEELEEICTSRGFELARESDEAVVYTHQDYVDAATECLQIEADLEEILKAHPEILDDVRRENERMMEERDRLLEQLEGQPHIQQMGTPVKQNGTEGMGASVKQNDSKAEVADGEEGDGETMVGSKNATVKRHKLPRQNSNHTVSPSALDDNNNKLTYGMKEITLEVIEQMKSDFAKVINFIVPKKLQELMKPMIKQHVLPALERIKLQTKRHLLPALKQHVLPSLKSSALVAKDMGVTVYNMARRYVLAFLNSRGGGNDDDKGSATNEGQLSGATNEELWPNKDLVGTAGEDAKAAVLAGDSALMATNVPIVPHDAMVTMDHREDRVRIFVDDDGRVTRQPVKG